MKHKGKHVLFLTEFCTHGFYKRNMRRTKRQKSSRHCSLRMGDGSRVWSGNRQPTSHSALMTHSAAEDDSDWSAKWNKHGFGARRAPIGCGARPSIQTGLRRRAVNCGSGWWIWTVERQCRVSLQSFTCYLSHLLPRKKRLLPP